MTCCGLDLSTSCSGYSIFQDNNLIAYGAIKPHGHDWNERIKDESLQLYTILQKYNPEYIYIEDVPLKPGSNTLLKLGAVHGMALAIASILNLTVIFLPVTSWRKKIGMYDGTASGLKRDILKEKAVVMANDIFGLNLKWVKPDSKLNDDDIAESILIAYSQIM